MLISEPSHPRGPAPDVRILVVDLEPDAGRPIRWILGEEGLGVETVPSAPAALERVARERPALVLLNLPLGHPRLATSGFGAELHRVGGGVVPLLLLDRALWTAEELRQAGAVGYLPKPFRGTQLVDAVWRALSTARRG
jgi:DNA-binding response OmpR family regulator